MLQNAVKNHRQEMCSPEKLVKRLNLATQEQFLHRLFPRTGTLFHPKTVWDWVVNKGKAADCIASAFCLLMSDGLKASSNQVSVKRLPSQPATSEPQAGSRDVRTPLQSPCLLQET